MNSEDIGVKQEAIQNPESKLEQAHRELEESITQLQSAISDLEKKLEPVLSPVTVGEEAFIENGSGKGEPSLSPLVLATMKYRRRMDYSITRILRVIERLEV